MHTEPLDRRVLLAIAATVTSTGTLTVAGSSAGEAIVVSNVADSIRVTSGAQQLNFPTADVRRLRVDAAGGADRIENQTKLRATLSGDGGDDTLLGGSGDDSLLGGDGVDLVSYENRISALSLGIFTGDGGETPDPVFGSGANISGSKESDLIDRTVERFAGTAKADSFLIVGFGQDEPVAVSVFGGGGDDDFNAVGADSHVYLFGDRGNDHVTIDEAITADFYGGAGNDSVFYDNESRPLPGFEVLDGGPGFDVASGRYAQSDPTRPLDYSQALSIDRIDGLGVNQPEYVLGPANGCEFVIGDDFAQNSDSAVTIVAGAGSDTIRGGEAADRLYGGNGDDVIDGGGGNDRIFAGAGNDSLLGGEGKDTLHGDGGDDTLLGGLGSDTLYGDDGYDLVTFEDRTRAVAIRIGTLGSPPADDSTLVSSADFGRTDERDAIAGDAEVFRGSRFNDDITIGGGDGVVAAIEVFGSGGDDTLFAASGNGQTTLYGDKGNDRIEIDESTSIDTAFGGAGDDTFVYVNNRDPFRDDGGPGNDSADCTSNLNLEPLDFSQTTSIESIFGFGGSGGDFLIGPPNACRIIANEQANNGVTLIGGNANDTLIGGPAADKIYGGGGDDLLAGGGGNDQLFGGDDNDSLFGNSGRDTLRGEAGDDVLTSNAGGIERLLGGAGTDTAIADGDDVLTDIESPGQI